MLTTPSPPAALHNAGPADRIPLGQGRTCHVAGEEIAVFRPREGRLFAVQARCPHRGGPLADGLTGAGRVLCPLHGFAFELDTGEPVGHACGALRTYPVSLTPAGDLLIEVDVPG